MLIYTPNITSVDQSLLDGASNSVMVLDVDIVHSSAAVFVVRLLNCTLITVHTVGIVQLLKVGMMISCTYQRNFVSFSTSTSATYSDSDDANAVALCAEPANRAKTQHNCPTGDRTSAVRACCLIVVDVMLTLPHPLM